MVIKMHSIIEDYDKAYRDMNDYLEGKTTKLNEGKNMNQYAVAKAFENVMIRILIRQTASERISALRMADSVFQRLTA